MRYRFFMTKSVSVTVMRKRRKRMPIKFRLLRKENFFFREKADVTY